MSAIFRPLSSRLYTIPRAQILVRLLDSTTLAAIAALRNLGDASIKINNKIEYEDIKSMEDSMHGIVASPAVDVQCDIEFSLRQFDAFTSSLMFMSDYGSHVTLPAASATTTTTFTGVQVGGIYQLVDANGQFVANATIAAGGIVDDATPVPNVWVVGVNYVFDALTGSIEVVAIPTTGTMDMVVTYGIPAPPVGVAPSIYNYLSQPEIYASVDVRTNPRMGMARLFHFPLVRIGITSGFSMSEEGNEPQKVDFSGKVLFDGRQVPGRERGYVRDLLPMAALGAF